MKKYDYIITGGGASGLSLLVHMIKSRKFSDKRILLIEKDPVKSNDRTWCFWEKDSGLFESIVYKSYQKLWFHTNQFSSKSDISPYTYKLIRGIDFYEYCSRLIHAEPNIEILHEEVDEMDSTNDSTYVMVNGEQYFADFVFNSIMFNKPVLKEREYLLLQHFMGWIIRTPSAVFDPGEATMMDFRTNQDLGTTFFYIMPFAENEALIEYTFFTEKIETKETYEAGLRTYITEKLKIDDYKVMDVETGSIPMTNYQFRRYDNNIVNIGTAGGDTKPSSGYTFQFVQKQCAKIVAALDETGRPFVEEPVAGKRFDFYDSTLLNVLYNRKVEGSEIFSRLFQYNDMRDVLEFLDNESSILKELKLISVLPTGIFMKSAFQQIFR